MDGAPAKKDGSWLQALPIILIQSVMRDWKQRRPNSTIGPHDLRVSRLLWGIVGIDFVVFITEYSGSSDFVLRGKQAGFLCRCSL